MIICYCDGLYDKVSKIGSYSFIVKDDGGEVYSFSRILVMSNLDSAIAEYKGFNALLYYLLKSELYRKEIEIRTDCKMIVEHKRHHYYNGNHLHLKKIHFEFIKAKNRVGMFKNLRVRWIPREKNREADALCNITYKMFIIKYERTSDKTSCIVK